MSKLLSSLRRYLCLLLQAGIWVVNAQPMAMAGVSSDASATTSQSAVQISSGANEPSPDQAKEKFQAQDWMVHVQNTDIVQGQPGFNSPYEGPNSLRAADNVRQTVSADIYLGAKLWQGGELYLNPEFFQGFGFANTHGVAAFTNGEAYKVGNTSGNVYIPHLFFRQTFGFGGEQEKMESDQLRLAGMQDISRFTVTIGRIQMGDQFDCNSYAHDPRTQFLNWALIDAGAFDYSADSLGATNGITLELNQKDWAFRAGGFMVPKVSNGLGWDQHLLKAWQDVFEYERRYSICGHSGKARILGWFEQADMGSYYQTLAQPALQEDITQTRKYRIQYGFTLNLEQEITDSLGAFVRLSWRDGQEEAWQFTDIDDSFSAGINLKGAAWGRKNDVFAFAGLVSGLTENHRNFLAAGGLGPLVGDGRLNYAPEAVIETYYNAQLVQWIQTTLDFQFIENPGYNQDRGPAFVFSARLHVAY